MHFKVD